MQNLKWGSALSVLAVAGLTAGAFAQQENEVNLPTPATTNSFVQSGTLRSGNFASNPGGNVVFQASGFGAISNSGAFGTGLTTQANDVFITEPGAVGSEILWYSVFVGGYSSGPDDCGPGTSDLPFDVTVALWAPTTGAEPASAANTVGYTNLRGGMPGEPIPGTECSFTGIPKDVAGSIVEVICKVSPGIQLPSFFYLVVDADDPGTQCAGVLVTGSAPQIGASSGRFRAPLTCENGMSDCPGFIDECADYGPPPTYMGVFQGISGTITSPGNGLGPICHFAFPTATDQDDYASIGFGSTFPAPFTSKIVVAGKPWACCDVAASTCSNVQESDCAGVFTQGTLCNDLPAGGCSEAGACCNVATGACANSFASSCTGFLEVFTAGQTCDTLSPACTAKGDNVPTVSQWGMIVLSALLLAGLTVKFGRRRSATA